MEASKKALGCLVLILSAMAAEARPRIPLLPPKEHYVALDPADEAELSGSTAAEARRPSYSNVTAETTQAPVRSEGSSWLFGGEIGTVGVQDRSSGNTLGLRLLYGARVVAVTRLFPRIYLKPSLGYFYHGEGVAKVSVAEHAIEAGLGLQYLFAQTGDTNWIVGLSQRLEAVFSRTSVEALTASSTGSTAEASGPGFRYRLGPSLGFTVRVAPGVGFTMETEATFSVTSPVKPYGAFGAGLLFKL